MYLLLTKNFDENYMHQAWKNFLDLLAWMKKTTILNIAGKPITFLALGVYCMAFLITVELIQKIFWGDD